MDRRMLPSPLWEAAIVTGKDTNGLYYNKRKQGLGKGGGGGGGGEPSSYKYPINIGGSKVPGSYAYEPNACSSTCIYSYVQGSPVSRP